MHNHASIFYTNFPINQNQSINKSHNLQIVPINSEISISLTHFTSQPARDDSVETQPTHLPSPFSLITQKKDQLVKPTRDTDELTIWLYRGAGASNRARNQGHPRGSIQ